MMYMSENSAYLNHAYSNCLLNCLPDYEHLRNRLNDEDSPDYEHLTNRPDLTNYEHVPDLTNSKKVLECKPTLIESAVSTGEIIT